MSRVLHILLYLLWVRYNCYKFYHCKICVRDFSEKVALASHLWADLKRPTLNMVNINLLVPENFVLFVFSNVFLWLSFAWMNICHFFWLLYHIIVIPYTTHFKGYLKISTWTSCYQYWLCIIFCAKWPIELLCSFMWQQFHFATIIYFSLIFFSFPHRHQLVL